MYEWSVAIEAAGFESTDELIEMLLDRLPDSSVTAGLNRVGARFTARGIDAAEASQAGVLAWRTVLREAGAPEMPIVRVDVVSYEELAVDNERPLMPELVGVAEVAAMLGVTKQRVSQLRTARALPAPMLVLASGPVWAAPAIEVFRSSWRRKPGPKPKRRAARGSNKPAASGPAENALETRSPAASGGW